MTRIIVTIALPVLVPAVPAAAGPNPSPVAPANTGTAPANVLAMNPQARLDAHSEPRGQQNSFAVAAAFCGIS